MGLIESGGQVADLEAKMGKWIFGYASLVWKAGFDYDERIVGFIKGYRRAFHLGELHCFFTLFTAYFSSFLGSCYPLYLDVIQLQSFLYGVLRVLYVSPSDT